MNDQVLHVTRSLVMLTLGGGIVVNRVILSDEELTPLLAGFTLSLLLGGVGGFIDLIRERSK